MGRDFLFLQSTTEQGGAETVLLNVLSASAELRERSEVVTLGFGKGDLPSRLRGIGASVTELEPARLSRPWSVLRRSAEVAARARALGACVIVGNGAHPQVFGSIASRLARTRSAYFVHMIHAPTLFGNHPIDALAIRSPCDLYLANSTASLEAMRRLRPSIPGELVHPGVPVETVEPAQASAKRAELGLPAEALVFGIFGRMQRWKGQDVFVEAASRVAEGLPGAHFIVVGGSVFGLEPEFEGSLKNEVQRLRLAARFSFLGQRTDVPALMAACDVVCHATRVPEPFGMVLVEAMAQARPVIATRPGGPGEIVADGVTGVLVEVEDPRGLAEAMLDLARNPARRARMGAAGLLRVRENFSAEASATRLTRALDRWP